MRYERQLAIKDHTKKFSFLTDHKCTILCVLFSLKSATFYTCNVFRLTHVVHWQCHTNAYGFYSIKIVSLLYTTGKSPFFCDDSCRRGRRCPGQRAHA